MLVSPLLTSMGGGTLFKVGGTSARWKETIENYLVSIGNWRHKHRNMKYDVITYTPYEGPNDTYLDKTTPLWTPYEGPNDTYLDKTTPLWNYTTMKTYRWTTWNSNNLL